MKTHILTIAFVFVAAQLLAQNTNQPFHLQDSLKKIESTTNQREKAEVYLNLGQHYSIFKGDSALFYLTEAERISKQENLIDLLPYIYNWMSVIEGKVTANYPMSLYHAFEELKSLKEMQYRYEVPGETEIYDSYPQALRLIGNQRNIAFGYAFLGNKTKALEYWNKIPQDIYLPEKWKVNTYTEFAFKFNLIMRNGVAAQFYILVNEYEKAKFFNRIAREENNKFPFEKQWCQPYIVYGDLLMYDKMYDSAINNYKTGIDLAKINNFYKDVLEANLGVANAYNELGTVDSVIVYAKNVINLSRDFTFTEGLLKANILLYKNYKKLGDIENAFNYLESADSLRNLLFNNASANEMQNMALNEEVKQRELNEQKAEQQRYLVGIVVCAVFLCLGIYLYAKRQQKERIRKIEEDRKNKELQAARDLQQSMLPKENPKRSDLDIATFIRSSTEVGGDYYDFFPQENGTLVSVCGDATGHGVTSGMMVSVTKAGLNGIDEVKPNKILKRLNNVVKKIDLGTLRMSLNIAEITTNKVFLSSAAMPPIYLYHSASETVEEFENNGLPLGGLRDEEFVLETRNFEKDDVLIQLSDGLPEAPNTIGELYDYDRLKALIQASGHLTAQKIIDVLIESVDQWLAGNRNPDDITLVVIKRK
uniref:SpoIIE family protein phosphatase n=1 Tax=Algoriphagus sp. TaxID=1872435 RepID=UPI004047C283